jgi:Mg2+ and Co2+ transporter CorA
LLFLFNNYGILFIRKELRKSIVLVFFKSNKFSYLMGDEMSDLLNKNLDNIESEIDLFGNKIEKLSMRDRIGFLPISIWEPDWNDVNRLKAIVGDTGETRELVGQKMQLMGSKYSTSIFNPHLAQMILSAYCPSNARIFDPFAGGAQEGL